MHLSKEVNNVDKYDNFLMDECFSLYFSLQWGDCAIFFNQCCQKKWFQTEEVLCFLDREKKIFEKHPVLFHWLSTKIVDFLKPFF